MPGWAKDTYNSYSSTYRSTASADKVATGEGTKAFGVELGLPSGGISLGADFEYMLKDSFGVGGYMHFWPKNTPDAPKQINTHNGYFTLGAQVAGHLAAGPLDLYIAPGFGIVNVTTAFSPNYSDTLTLGPRLAIGVLYPLTDKFSLGAEVVSQWIWFDSDYSNIGPAVEDFGIKGRYAF